MLYIYGMSQCSMEVKQALADLTVSVLKEATSLCKLDLYDSGFESDMGERIRGALEQHKIIKLTDINLSLNIDFFDSEDAC